MVTLSPINRVHRSLLASASVALVSAMTLIDLRASAWPEFRGPSGQGKVDTKSLPLKWSNTENVRWKTPIHGRAWSSPVLDDKQIWLSSANEKGTELFAICVDPESGKIVRDFKLFDVEKPQYAHPFNTYASPTPVLEPDRVYITFGSPGTACVDRETRKVIWQRVDLQCNHFRGAGSSPAIYKNLLIMNFDGSDYQYVIALDKKTGETVWKTDRSLDFKDLTPQGKPSADGDWRKAFSTPVIAAFEGRDLLISQGSKAVYGYEPATGKELWHVEEQKTHSAGGRPSVGHGLIYVSMGQPKSELWAIKPGGSGDVTSTHVAWKVKRNVPTRTSPVLADDLIFMVDDGGIASCVDAKTGDVVWSERITSKTSYSAAPIWGAGRIYFCSEDGMTTVLAASREFKVLATNQLGEGFMSSPAVLNNSLVLRSKTHLYRID